MRKTPSRLVLLSVPLLVTLAGADPMARQRARTAPPERALDFLHVDFVAVREDGTPIADLRADEITIRVSGRTRPVRSLQFIETAADAAQSADTIAPPFATNATQDAGRTLLLAVEDDSFRPGREGPLRAAVDRLIEGLGSHDRISLITVPYGGVKVASTTEHARIRAALAQIVGQRSATETGSELACRTRETLEALSGHLEQLGIRQSAVTVMLITAGLAAPRRDAAPMLAPGMCELTVDMFKQVGVAAAAARAQFYIIQPEEMMVTPTTNIRPENIAGTNFRGSDNPMEGLEHLAGVTGGRMLNLTGSAETALGRVLRESAGHYVAAIEPQRSDRNGRALPLDVRVARHGAVVRTRPSIVFPPEDPATRLASPSPRDMIAVSSVFRDLPLRASAYTLPEAAGTSMRIVTLAEPAEQDVAFSSVMVALFDRNGRAVSHWVATEQELARLPVIGAMTAEPGAYRVRVAAIDTSGRAGTADYELDAEIARTGPLKLSSVVLGLSRGGEFIPRLQFGSEAVAIGYLELEGAPPGSQVSAILELARSANAPALTSVPLAIAASGPNRYSARGALAIGALPPGDYIVRAIVGIEGHPPTRVLRTLRKVASR